MVVAVGPAVDDEQRDGALLQQREEVLDRVLQERLPYDRVVAGVDRDHVGMRRAAVLVDGVRPARAHHDTPGYVVLDGVHHLQVRDGRAKDRHLARYGARLGHRLPGPCRRPQCLATAGRSTRHREARIVHERTQCLFRLYDQLSHVQHLRAAAATAGVVRQRDVSRCREFLLQGHDVR